MVMSPLNVCKNNRKSIVYAILFLTCFFKSCYITCRSVHRTSHWKKPLAISQISVGCISAAVCDIRVIAKIAIDTLASSVILCHNHPSGNLEESAADIKLLDNVNKTLKIFGCELVDHIILTESSYTSLNGKF